MKYYLLRVLLCLFFLSSPLLANDEEAMEALLAHRFRNPKLRGLNFGDIYIAGMTEVNGSFNSSIESAGNILNMTGKVISNGMFSYNKVA